MARDQSAPITQRSPVPIPTDSEAIPIFLDGELNRLWSAIQAIAEGHETIVHVAPEKPREGDKRFADGSDWDPGDGKGLYIYQDGAWQRLAESGDSYTQAEADANFHPLGGMVDEIEVTGNRTLLASDVGKMLRVTSAATLTIDGGVIPAQAVINTLQWGAGQITFAQGSGATLRYHSAVFNAKSLGTMTMQTLYFHNTNNPVLGGQLELA